MISSVALQFLLGAFRRCARRGIHHCEEDEFFREVLVLFWDLQYLYKYGIVTDLTPSLPHSTPFADPTPTPVLERLGFHDELLFNMMGALADDPEPEPGILSVLGNREIRLVAAKGLAERLESGLESVKAEIDRLG
jgi:hypothetical protein